MQCIVTYKLFRVLTKTIENSRMQFVWNQRFWQTTEQIFHCRCHYMNWKLHILHI